MAAVEELLSAEINVEEEAGPLAAVETPLCQMCLLAPSKYKCPGCDMRTCSLACVKTHKEPKEGRTGCNGKRDRLKYVSLAEFDDRTLLSDYQLLEEVKRADDVARRCLPPFPRHQLPPALQTLIYQANKRRVDLRLMAPGMSRRIHNTTRFNGQDQKLSWRIEWHFYSASSAAINQGLVSPVSLPLYPLDADAKEMQQGKRLKVADEIEEEKVLPLMVAPVNEEEVDLGDGKEEEGAGEGLEEDEAWEGQEGAEDPMAKLSEAQGEASAPLLLLTPSQLPPPIVLVDEKVAEDHTLLQILQEHLSQFRPNSGAGARQFSLRDFGRDASILKVFMRKEEQPANNPCYYSMDLNRSLGSQLAGKIVIEFPVFLVCLPALAGCFPAGVRGSGASGAGFVGGGQGGRGEGMRGGRFRGRGGGFRGRGGRGFDGQRGRGFRGGGRGGGGRGNNRGRGRF